MLISVITDIMDMSTLHLPKQSSLLSWGAHIRLMCGGGGGFIGGAHDPTAGVMGGTQDDVWVCGGLDWASLVLAAPQAQARPMGVRKTQQALRRGRRRSKIAQTTGVHKLILGSP